MMKRVLSDEGRKLIGFLKTRVDQDTCIGLILMLKTDENFIAMREWIEQNMHAGQTEIMNQMDIILEMVPYYTLPPMPDSPVTAGV